MDATTHEAQPTTTTPAATKPPWYSLNPRTLKRSLLIRALLIGLVVASFSVVPLWRLLWYWPVYSWQNCKPVTDAHGVRRQAWRWVERRAIRIYAAPGVKSGQIAEVAQGVQAMVDEVGLQMTVTVLPMPKAVLNAYQAATVAHNVDEMHDTSMSFAKLEQQLITLRDGDPHADILIINQPIEECWWAHGMATFTSGVSVMQENNLSFHLGKHETGHLLGYQVHDSFPLYVVGYPWEGWPWSRDTLMMIYGESNTLSPRAHDALHAFWRGLEKRTGKTYLR